MSYSAEFEHLEEYLKSVGINADNTELFEEALTHPSYNFERNAEGEPDYERLEFLGDSVVRIFAGELLFDKYPDFDEGKLTKIRSYIVSDKFLSAIAVKINLNNYIRLGAHEEKDGGREKESINACAMEAFIGAVYKTCGYECAEKFVYGLYSDFDKNIDFIMEEYNSKEILQQYTQSLNKDLPEYEIINESGPAHNKTFEVSVKYNGEEIGRGKGKTKKDAEKSAAFNAVTRLKIRTEDKNE